MTVDTSKLTYSYTITDSQYGLTGKSASGTLTPNGDGTYSMSGVDGAKIATLPNGLLLGAIREPINGALLQVFEFSAGFSSARLAGMQNA